MVAINDRFGGLASKLDLDQLSSTRPVRSEEAEPTSAHTEAKGSSFSVSLRLESGTEVEFGVRRGVAGQYTDLTLYASTALTDKEKAVFESVVQGLARGIDQLFSGRADGQTDLFQSLAGAPIDELEVSASHNIGVLSQQLSLDQDERRSGETRLTSDWQQSDLDVGINDRHGFDLLKRPGAVAQAYGQVDTGWLEQKLAAATSALGATRNLAGGLQSAALGSFYGSGLNALLQAANDGSRALQELGASPDQARYVVGQTLDALAHRALKPGDNSAVGIQSTPDFDGTFTSHRSQGFRETGPGTYNFDLTLKQDSHQSYDPDADSKSLSQRRELSLSYRTDTDQQSLSLSWSSKERQRYTLVDGQMDSSESRRQDTLMWLIQDAQSRANGYQQMMERYNVDYSTLGETQGLAELGNDGRYSDYRKHVNYQV